jgi:hypothetical protein
MDLDIAKAEWAFGKADEAAQLAKLPKEAVAIARVIHHWAEVTRTDANNAGAWIREYKGYITRQSHDAEKIGRMKFDAWKKLADKHFDIPRMLRESEHNNAETMLQAMHTDLAAGDHLQALPNGDEVSPFKGPANFAKKASESRVIHFKSADDWFAYNKEAGTGNLRESVCAG